MLDAASSTRRDAMDDDLAGYMQQSNPNPNPSSSS